MHVQQLRRLGCARGCCNAHSFVSSDRRLRNNINYNTLPCKRAYTSLPAALPPHTKSSVKRTATSRTGVALRVMALDAAMPFDFEHKMAQRMEAAQKLKIGLVGFGTFGQFLAKRLVKHGHEVIATSRSPYHEVAKQIGVQYFTDPDDFCEEHPDIVVLCTSILSTADVLSALPVQRLRRSTLFVDVLSVKVFPKNLMLDVLPPEIDILCTHPMFGPDSGKGSWSGLNFMYDKVRVGTTKRRQQRAEALLKVFDDEGCRMVEMSCEEHDRLAASTQFITHTVGRMLGAMQLTSTTIDTKGFQSLLNLVDNTNNDSFDLYYGLFLYNQNATEELFRLETAFDDVKRQLFDRLHGILRQQLFREPSQPTDATAAADRPPSPSPSLTQQNGSVAGDNNGTRTGVQPNVSDVTTAPREGAQEASTAG